MNNTYSYDKLVETVDIISFDLNDKLPFHLKRGPVTEAIKKGIMFEICYSQAVEGKLTSLCN